MFIEWDCDANTRMINENAINIGDLSQIKDHDVHCCCCALLLPNSDDR